jgi:exopolysaccharide biosynthesis polyprenyl glycosylphosphotransferase
MSDLPQLSYPEVTSSTPTLDLRAQVLTLVRRGGGLGWLQVAGLVAVDSALVAVAWQLAQAWGTAWGIENPLPILLVTTIGSMAARGLYASSRRNHGFSNLFQAVTFAHILLLVIAYLIGPGVLISRSMFLLSWIWNIVLLGGGRISIDLGVHILREQGTALHPIFLIGHPADRVRAAVLLRKENRFSIRGELDIKAVTNQSIALEEILASGAEEVFLCSADVFANPSFLYWSLRNAGLSLRLLPLEMKAPCWKSELRMIGSTPSLKFSPPLIIGGDFWLKRCFDFAAGTLLLLALSPLYLLIALLIKLDSPGPVFYKQRRVGLHNRSFEVWKFRTMVQNADKLQAQMEKMNESKDGILFKIKKDPRITRVGSVLRRYSLDELPQIFNVLFGEMSLVGPRPLPLRDVARFSEQHFMRHAVLPGISGLWQVSGRSETMDFEQVVRLDLAYIEDWSLLLDLQILLRTVVVVFQRRGAY